MKKGDLVTVLTNAGEFIGRLDKNDETGVHIDNPKMIVNTKEGKMGFARGVCMTGEKVDGTLQFNKTCVAFVLPTMKEIATGWQTQTSGIQVPQKGVILS